MHGNYAAFPYVVVFILLISLMSRCSPQNFFCVCVCVCECDRYRIVLVDGIA